MTMDFIDLRTQYQRYQDEIARRMKAQGIPTAVYYPKCLHEQPVFAGAGYRAGDFPVAEQAAREVLSLPMHPFLGEKDQDRVVASLKSGAKFSTQ